MPFNFLAILVAALSSFVVGFVWYNPKVFGTIWMKESGLTQEQCEKGNMLKIFGLTFVYSLMLAFLMPTLVIHQMGTLGMIGGPDFDGGFRHDRAGGAHVHPQCHPWVGHQHLALF